MNQPCFTAHLLLLVCSFQQVLHAQPADSSAERSVFRLSHSNETISAGQEIAPLYRGWDYLAGRLKTAGIEESRLNGIFNDPRLPVFSPIPFKLKPRESSQMYSHFLGGDFVKKGLDCLQSNNEAFSSAEKLFHVDRKVIAAILVVETQCGKVTGTQPIFNRLARIASVAEPLNVQHNLRELKRLEPSLTLEEVQTRARYLEDLFLPEVAALIQMCAKTGEDIFAIKGSYAGAFGIPQFLPSIYLKYSVDGDKDGSISLFSMPDAVWSTAHYLASLGWKDSAPQKEKKAVLFKYNRSDPYVDTVLKLAAKLSGSKALRVKAPLKKTPAGAPAFERRVHRLRLSLRSV